MRRLGRGAFQPAHGGRLPHGPLLRASASAYDGAAPGLDEGGRGRSGAAGAGEPRPGALRLEGPLGPVPRPLHAAAAGQAPRLAPAGAGGAGARDRRHGLFRPRAAGPGPGARRLRRRLLQRHPGHRGRRLPPRGPARARVGARLLALRLRLPRRDVGLGRRRAHPRRRPALLAGLPAARRRDDPRDRDHAARPRARGRSPPRPGGRSPTSCVGARRSGSSPSSSSTRSATRLRPRSRPRFTSSSASRNPRSARSSSSSAPGRRSPGRCSAACGSCVSGSAAASGSSACSRPSRPPGSRGSRSPAIALRCSPR